VRWWSDALKTLLTHDAPTNLGARLAYRLGLAMGSRRLLLAQSVLSRRARWTETRGVRERIELSEERYREALDENHALRAEVAHLRSLLADKHLAEADERLRPLRRVQ
jgi:hypothetical protein